MNARADNTDRRVNLENHRMQVVSMPRHQRPLYVAEPSGTFDGPFWPKDSADWSLCKWLAALDLSLIGLLVYLVVSR